MGMPMLEQLKRKSTLLLLALLVSLSGCSGPEKPKPVDLGANVALVGINTAWTSRIGKLDFPLSIQAVENVLYVAGAGGQVAAVDSRTGADVWRVSLGTELSAGVGSDGRFAAVVSQENELIVLDRGRQIWKQKLGALTLTAPLVAGERVFVLSSDRSVSAFDAATGRKLWQQQRTGEALVLGQSGVILAVGDTLVTGLGGRLVGLNPANGNTRWSAPIATSRGVNEIERLVDLVAGVSRDGQQICVRAFQSAVGCVDTSKGGVTWVKPAFGFAGVHGNANTLVGTEKDGKVVAWRRTDGEVLWTSERLRYRALSAPLMVGQLIVVGDESGMVHFLSREDGAALNRLPTDGSAVVAAPVLVGNTVVVVTQAGGVFGFKPE
jgi:outer membrane protein assembly factor BamB